MYWQEPNSASDATTRSPARSRQASEAKTAAMPVAVARAASAPSSSAMRSSNICSRIAEARIDEARARIGEGGLRLLRRAVDEARAHIDRLAGLAEGRAQDAA